MAKGKRRAATKSSTLVAHNFLPALSKPGKVIGDFISMPGSEWGGCPASQKASLFRCVVRQFDAVHEFPGGTKSAGFQVQEMGESGEGICFPGLLRVY